MARRYGQKTPDPRDWANQTWFNRPGGVLSLMLARQKQRPWDQYAGIGGEGSVAAGYKIDRSTSSGNPPMYEMQVRGGGRKEHVVLSRALNSNKGVGNVPLNLPQRFQTREVRLSGHSFVQLPQHMNTPLLRPGLSKMWAKKDKVLGPVRRARSRLL
jgi:hypothetical protein